MEEYDVEYRWRWFQIKGWKVATKANQLIELEFACPQCGQVENLALTGMGLTAWYDIQKHRYVFASCTRCGYTQVYNLRILQGQANLDIILESLFTD